MDLAFSWIPIVFLIAFLMSLNIIKKKWKKEEIRNAIKKKLPPGPRKLPIIGNLHNLMGPLPHHALNNLSQKYGDLMHLQMGEVSAIVASSPRPAKDILKTHDLAFTNKKILLQQNVRSFGSIRQDEVSKLVASIREQALMMQSKQGINVTKKVSSYTSSMVCKAAFGRAFGEEYRDKLVKYQKEVLAWTSGFDVSDIFPSLKILHHLSLMKPKLARLHTKIDEILDTIIQEHIENPVGSNSEFNQLRRSG
ncbi:OLC1v1020195C1 [Oldenlandia corymbosa var. corymbosa]|uniref:OLC1v1020195C1 n=1 Tax=Oldenlandia corymbosa var. corymbosa TaxID=529605 RepID=A0AAV1EFX8_OLDCO|nr:OLC1v1020195C1 [Oldenlandia corymbosa var. corymbosa]